jgi:hypothetical protein
MYKLIIIELLHHFLAKKYVIKRSKTIITIIKPKNRFIVFVIVAWTFALVKLKKILQCLFRSMLIKLYFLPEHLTFFAELRFDLKPD